MTGPGRLRAAVSRVTQLGELEPRDAARILAAILLVSAACATLHAISRPLWNDEIITAIVSDQPSLHDIWNALVDAADTNPPAFYYAARFARWFVADEHLAHRLPSIVGLLCAMTCVFLFLARRVSGLAALAGSAFLLVTRLEEYSYEARPYSLMIACLALAMLSWQRAEDSKWYALPLAAGLAASLSLHYYAAFVWPVFVIAEGAALMRRRLRPHLWLAIAAGATPLLVFAPLLMNLRQFYGQDYWARTSLAQALVVHDWLFLRGGHSGAMLMAGLSLALIYGISVRTVPRAAPQSTVVRDAAVPTEEYVLLLMTLWMPAIAVTLALLTGAGLTDRHFLPATLGGAVAVGLLVSRATPSIGAVLLALFMSSYLYSAHNDIGRAWKGALLEQRRSETAAVEQIVRAAADTDKPLVVSPALDYLEAVYFASPGARSRLHWLADPAAAVRFSGSGSPDLALIRLQHWIPLHVEEYRAFAEHHRDFVLVGGRPASADWWPERLVHDGHRLELMSFAGGRPIYSVTLQP